MKHIWPTRSRTQLFIVYYCIAVIQPTLNIFSYTYKFLCLMTKITIIMCMCETHKKDNKNNKLRKKNTCEKRFYAVSLSILHMIQLARFDIDYLRVL